MRAPTLFAVFVPAALGAAAFSLSWAQPPFQLEAPIACEFGKTCFIQQYADHDPGPGAKDYLCKSLTYDGHDGVDIRVPDAAAVKRGVPVLAAAAGKVKAMRDDMFDADPRTLPPGALKGKECGNGVILTHADGWETQYCHMEIGSIVVRPGQTMKAGDKLGLVGQSGQAEFPHVHLTVRKDGKWVEPFAFGAPPGACGGGRNLFSARAAQAMAYRSPQLLNAGFTTAPPSMADLDRGLESPPTLPADAPALVAFARVIGLEAGDVMVVTLKDPSGGVAAENRTAPMERPKAQYFAFSGVKRKAAWAKGQYLGQVQVIRDGKTVLDHTLSLTSG